MSDDLVEEWLRGKDEMKRGTMSAESMIRTRNGLELSNRHPCAGKE